LRRSEVLGLRIDDFFATVGGATIPEAWSGFVAGRFKRGICKLKAAGRERRFEFQGKANFAPGLHMSVLREVTEDVES
jgi:hypothetical protein